MPFLAQCAGFPPKRPSVTAPWRLNFWPWCFSVCRDALGNSVMFFLTMSWCFRTTLGSCCDVQQYRLDLTALHYIGLLLCRTVVRGLSVRIPVVIWCHVVRPCWQVYQRVAGCMRQQTRYSIVRVVCDAGSTFKRVVPPAVFAAITEHTSGVSQSSTVSTQTQRQHSAGY